MNEAQRAAIGMIGAQQAKLKEGSAPWVVGEQLRELCEAEPESAALLQKDLENPQMSLSEAEKQIKGWADKHKTGDFAFVSPQKAEEILRKFYGLPGRGTKRSPEPQRDDGIIDLSAFL